MIIHEKTESSSQYGIEKIDKLKIAIVAQTATIMNRRVLNESAVVIVA